MGFEQATIQVEKQQQFEQLQSAIARCCSAENVGKFLKTVRSAGLRVRDVEGVLAKGILDRAQGLKAGTSSQLYQALTTSDRAQVREFYLFRVEEIDPQLRTKFHKLYQYY